MKKVVVKVDGDEVKVEMEGFVGMTCAQELQNLNLPVEATQDITQPDRGVSIAEKKVQY